jgi:solute:Na+ symporter, SSS family
MTYLVILIAYAAAMIALGVVTSRRVKASSDFFVAGRGLGAGLLFSTLLAANIGAGSTVGATGLGYRHGLSAWWWVGSAGIGSLILAFTVGPKMWRVAKAHDLYTVGDYLELRYDRRVRALAALLLWCGSLSILAGQLIAIAWVLNVTAGFGKPLGCAVGAAVATTYFTLGGLHGSARVNALQLVIKLVGFGSVFLWSLPMIAGRGAADSVNAIPPPPFADLGAAGALSYLAILAPSFVVSPGLLQKIFGARDEKAARAGVAWNAVALLAFAVIPPVVGVVARYEFPNLENPELALPTLLTERLPVWFGGLLLGAIFAAEVSTADAVLFMLTTSLSKDLYQSWLRPQASDRQLMRVARVTAAACGAVGALLAVWLPTVIAALTIFYSLLTAALLLPVVAGLYSARVTARSAMATMIVSVAVTFAVHAATKGKGYGLMPPVIFGVAAGAVLMFAARGRRRSKTAAPG